MILNPHESYSIELPDGTLQESEERVFSVWRDGSHVAIQLSSYERHSGEQVGAEVRLTEMMVRNGGTWGATGIVFNPRDGAEIAAAKMVDEEGFTWIHIYVVWPRLAVYVTLSKPPYEGDEALDWAVRAVNSIRVTKND